MLQRLYDRPWDGTRIRTGATTLGSVVLGAAVIAAMAGCRCGAGGGDTGSGAAAPESVGAAAAEPTAGEGAAPGAEAVDSDDVESVEANTGGTDAVEVDDAAGFDGVLKPAPTPGEVEAFPGVFVDRAGGAVDLLGYVIEPVGLDWLELIACVAGTREHEALIGVYARPSHVHAALLTLGVEPGRPHWVERVDEDGDGDAERFIAHGPTGPPVRVYAVVPVAGEANRVVPINEWVRVRETEEALAGNAFLFTGSVFYEREGQSRYAADAGGTVVSLVQFGDDLIARDTPHTNQDGTQTLDPFRERLPEAGTIVRLRLVVDPAGAAAGGTSENQTETPGRAEE